MEGELAFGTVLFHTGAVFNIATKAQMRRAL